MLWRPSQNNPGASLAVATLEDQLHRGGDVVTIMTPGAAARVPARMFHPIQHSYLGLTDEVVSKEKILNLNPSLIVRNPPEKHTPKWSNTIREKTFLNSNLNTVVWRTLGARVGLISSTTKPGSCSLGWWNSIALTLLESKGFQQRIDPWPEPHNFTSPRFWSKL